MLHLEGIVIEIQTREKTESLYMHIYILKQFLNHTYIYSLPHERNCEHFENFKMFKEEGEEK